MKKPQTVLVVCTGVSALMMDQMSRETIESLVTGVRKQQKKDIPLDQIAAEKIYRDEDGRIGLPISMLTKALISAGRNVKNGRKAVSTAESTTLFSFLQLEGEFLPFANIPANVEPYSEGEKAFWATDLRRGVGYNAKTPTAVGIVRPKFKEWTFQIKATIDTDKIDPTTVRALFDEAGLTQGLGSFRPNKRGPFGMFTVSDWKVVEDAKPTTAQKSVARPRVAVAA